MMKGFKELGVAMTGVIPVNEAVELARVAEQSGLGSAWFAEDYFFRGGIPYMAAAAMATEKLRIGLGVVNPFSRHPALIAMEFATLDEMSNMRTVFGDKCRYSQLFTYLHSFYSWLSRKHQSWHSARNHPYLS